MEKIKFIVNRSEITAGTRGASLGPDAIKVVAWQNKSELFGKYPTEEIECANHLLNTPIVHQFAKRIEGLTFIFDKISNAVKTAIAEDHFPLILAGDHGSAGGTIAGLKATYPDKRLGVIWIDAHGDLHTPYTTPSGNMHGMPLAAALCEDNLVCKRNDIPEQTKELWDKLKNTGFAGPKVKPEDIIFIGVRDLEEEEIALMNQLNIRNFTVQEVESKGAATIAKQINEQLDVCDLIYISFDVDSMDPQETSHGTGTPVDNGLCISDTKILMTELAKNPKVACIEFVEVNPCLDEKKNKMAEVAHEVLQEVIKVIEEK